MTLERTNASAISETAFVYSGVEHQWHAANVSLNLSPLGQAPLPVLGEWFLMNSTGAALIPRDFQPLLNCPHGDSTFKQCAVESRACNCEVYPKAQRLNCSCMAYNLEKYFADKTAVLPLNLPNVKLYQREADLRASIVSSPVNVAMRVSGMHIAVQDIRARCRITSTTVTGCYNCLTGGRVFHKCISSFGEIQASVQCRDGTQWMANCSPEGRKNSIIGTWSHPKVSTECSVDCGDLITTFPLNGTLIYLDRMPERTGVQVKYNSAQNVGSDFSFMKYWLEATFEGPVHYICAFLAGAGIISIFVLILKCNTAISGVFFAQARAPTILARTVPVSARARTM